MFSVFIAYFKHISHLALVFLLLTLNMQMPTGVHFLLKARFPKTFVQWRVIHGQF